MNTILKTAVLAVALFSLTTSFGQTKEETEYWILEKLSLYGTENYYQDGGSNYNRKYQLDGTNLIYTYEQSNTLDKYDQRVIIKIPLWAIESVSAYDGGLRFSLKSYCKECTSEKTWKVKSYRYKKVPYTETKYGWGNNGQTQTEVQKTKTIKIDNGYEYKSDSSSEMHSLNLTFKSDPEENFLERFSKAINHLKTFYPKPVKKKEAF